MDFNFHKGDYVEVSDGTKGYVIEVTNKDKEVHFTLSTGDTCNINQYIGNGEYESVIYSSNVIDKINELIGVVNKLSKRLDGLTNE